MQQRNDRYAVTNVRDHKIPFTALPGFCTSLIGQFNRPSQRRGYCVPKRLVAALLILLLAFSYTASSAAEAFEIARADVAPAIISRAETTVTLAARQRLAHYLETNSGSRPHSSTTVPATGVSIILGGPSIALEFGCALPDPSSSESFTIQPASGKRHSLLIITGQSDVGIKQGVYHLLRNLTRKGDRLLLLNPTIRSSPFLKLRVTHIGGYTRQVADPATGARLKVPQSATREQNAVNLVHNWEPARLADYIDMLDMFGYNGIEFPPALYRPSDNDATSTVRRRAVRQRITSNGIRAVLKLDGTLFDGEGSVPYGSDTEARYHDYYRTRAEAAAHDMDYVLTHWVDAGGWKSTPQHPCTIELLQDLHMQIDSHFKRVNPRIESILSLWALGNPQYQRWLGYQGVDTILGSGKIPKKIGLTMARIYKPDEARKISGAGHEPGVWGWYMADQELIYTMHVHSNRMKQYFSRLPANASRDVFFHSLDNCQRDTNLYSVYVGARLMWNPEADADALLREVARLVYGPKLEDPVFNALKAIADVRCGDVTCKGYWNPLTTRTATTALRDSQTSNGILWFSEAHEQSQRAWTGLRNVQIDRTYIPPLPLHREPGVLLDQLKAHVEAIAAYMQFLRQKEERQPQPLEVPRSKGPFEFYERMRYMELRDDTSAR